MKRLSATAALAVAGVTAAVVAGSGASAQVPAAGPRTIAFSEIESKNPCCIADVAPKSRSKREPFMSPGDQLVFSQELRAASGKRIGRLYSKCTSTAGAPLSRARYVCEGVYRFADGTLTTAGIADFAETSTGAVTGGTGAYANARGTFSVKTGRTKNDVIVTLVN